MEQYNARKLESVKYLQKRLGQPLPQLIFDNDNNNNIKVLVDFHGGQVLSRVINDENNVGVGEWDTKNYENDEKIANDSMVAGQNEISDVEFKGFGLSASYHNINICNNEGIKEEEEW